MVSKSDLVEYYSGTSHNEHLTLITRNSSNEQKKSEKVALLTNDISHNELRRQGKSLFPDIHL